MAINQPYEEERVLELPTSGLVAGYRYYLNVGPNKYKTFIVSDSLVLTAEAGAEFIEKDTMAEFRAISAREIWAIQNGYYKGVKLNGYYESGDTPSPIVYYISDTTDADDGGSVVAVGNIKFTHDFGPDVDAVYFGTNYGNIASSYITLKRAIDYIVKNNKNLLLYNKGYDYTIQQELRLLQGGNYSITAISNPVIKRTTEGMVFGTPSNSETSLGFIVAPGSLVKEGDYNLTLTNTTEISIGDVIRLRTTESLGPLVPSYVKGEYVKVVKIDGNILTFDKPLSVDYLNIGDIEIVKPITRDFIKISGLVFNGVGTSTTIVKMDNFNNSSLEDCISTTDGERVLVGIQVTGYNTFIRRCFSYKAYDPSLGAGYGFNTGGSFVTLIECEARDCKHAFTVAPSQHIATYIQHIRCNAYNSIGQKALDIHGGACYCSFIECSVYNSAGFMNLRGFKGMYARRNKFFGDKKVVPNQEAINLRSEVTGKLVDAEIIGNHIYDFNHFTISSNTEGTVENAKIQGNFAVGGTRFFSMFSTSTRNTRLINSIISENICLDFTINAGLIIFSGDNNQVVGNPGLTVNTGVCIDLRGNTSFLSRNNIIDGNNIARNGGGVPFSQTYTENTVYRGNKLTGGFTVTSVDAGNNSNLQEYDNIVEGQERSLTQSLVNNFTAPSVADASKTVTLKNFVANNVWWRDVQKIMIQRGSIGSTINWNTLIQPGVYVKGTIPSPTDISTYNIPVAERGNLIVFNSVDNFIGHLYLTTSGKVFCRGLFNTTWSEWCRLDSLQEILSTSRPVLANGDRKVFLETDTNRIVSGQGGSSTTTWRDAMGVVIT